MAYLLIIVVLVVLALAGWIVAWRNGGSQTAPGPETGPSHATVDYNKIQTQAGEQLVSSIQKASELFQKNLTVQALKINDELEGLAGQRLKQQIEDFNRVLDGLTTTATDSVAQLESLIDQRRHTLEASLTTDVMREKQRAIEHFYDRLGDIVANYIIQSLGKDLDLSGQLPFVLKVLSDNKDSIMQDLLGGY